MKRIYILMLFLIILSNLFGKINFYGKIRMGMWYNYYDKYQTGAKQLISLKSGLYSSSYLGIFYKAKNFNTKVEIGIKNQNMTFLRLAYGEYYFGNIKILFGQDYTGFNSSNYSAQSALIDGESDFSNIGIGAFYDGRKPMIKFSMDNGLFLIFMQPEKVDPAFLSENNIDALIPKTNIGLDYENNNFSIHPTFGINYCKYNAERNFQNIEDKIIAYVFSTTISYHKEKFCIKGQINYAQNASDYGIKGLTNASSYWENDSINNSKTFGGYIQLGLYNVNNCSLITGIGYTATKNEKLMNKDNGVDIFIQFNKKFSKNFALTPEVGYINFLDDGNGNKEGSIVYCGARLQALFK